MKTIVCFGFVLGALSAAGEVILAKPRGTVIIPCGVDTYRQRLEWKHEDDTIIVVHSKNSRPSKGQSSFKDRSRMRGETALEINRLTEGDAGKFTCIVDGKHHDHTLLIVSVSVSPSADPKLGSEATLQCQVSGLSPVSPVQWMRPGGSQPTEPNPVHLKSVAKTDEGNWTCMFSHGGNPYRKTLDIKVADPDPTTSAPTQNGNKNDHKKTCSNCATNSPSSTAAQLLGLSWWMWVVVGVGCLVVVLLMVFVIVLYKRIKTRKRKLQKMKNSRQPLTTKQYCQCNRRTAAAKPQQGRRREKSSAPPLQPLLIE